MDQCESSSAVHLTAESQQLVKSLLERHRFTQTRDQDVSPRAKRVEWVSIDNFTVDEGKRQIKEYIETWQLRPSWFYSLDYLSTTEERCHAFHHYRARFSTPTPQRPIGGTACVYFAICIPEASPRTEPVEVGYIVESKRLMHIPGAIRFTEQWLLDVIDSKIILRETLKL